MTPNADAAARGVTAIVLAGGRAARFGGPKLAARIGGDTLLERAIQAAASVADEVIVAVAPGDGPPGGGAAGSSGHVVPIRSVADDEPFAGPLAGLAGALRGTSTELAIVVGGDMPGLVPAVLAVLLERLLAVGALDAALLAAPDPDTSRRQVLPLALRVGAAAAAARAAIEAGDRSLVRLLDRLRSIEIPASEWLALDPEGRTLLDVDRPSDLARIHRELR
jgi:molybdopterin-guanine dinucleotide biosynthesis protein A